MKIRLFKMNLWIQILQINMIKNKVKINQLKVRNNYYNQQLKVLKMKMKRQLQEEKKKRRKRKRKKKIKKRKKKQ